MGKILSLEYGKIMPDFFPGRSPQDAQTLEDFSRELSQMLFENSCFHSCSINLPRNLEVKVEYKNFDSPNSNSIASQLIFHTTHSLGDAFKIAGGKDYSKPFVLRSSRILPVEVYEAEVYRKVLSSLLEQIKSD
ncbi:hypothetical protein HN832_02420 [archaeon]|jgi:hypothetical protein|nr:hypothetical protein [archaeon]MBT4373209.1 hypothetical protein [archaeon]MBT4531554.1 hypothetical protein [archaeon]MBT7001268.1 hypothetical protein [archaeon]MBT7282246.1 hypothetical protein [archaeon]